MGQSAAQWARGQIQAGEPDDKMIDFHMNGVPTRMALWDMASMAEVSDMMDKAVSKMLQSTVKRKSTE